MTALVLGSAGIETGAQATGREAVARHVDVEATPDVLEARFLVRCRDVIELEEQLFQFIDRRMHCVGLRGGRRCDRLGRLDADVLWLQARALRVIHQPLAEFLDVVGRAAQVRRLATKTQLGIAAYTDQKRVIFHHSSGPYLVGFSTEDRRP